jgi:lysophospholipase L1-like esterase
MKILFYGDSITDCSRTRDGGFLSGLGYGYVHNIALDLIGKDPEKYQIINRGISGNRVVDLYARIKMDCWNHNPDVLSILIGVNDVWHEIAHKNGVELDRFEKVYRMLIEDTLKVLPNVKIMILEPFILKGIETESEFDKFLLVKEYAKVAKKLALEFNLTFIPLQDKFDDMASRYGVAPFLFDGVHPNIAGAKLIAKEWLNAFENI